MNEPNLGAIPGILIRTVMRFLARLVLIVAWVSLLITAALLLAALFLGTFRSARTPWQQASASVIRALTDIAKAVRSDS